ncbi:MAG: RagB/SusD family nutrient uptake outer membrane protein, partial [Chitinophagales bacterium]
MKYLNRKILFFSIAMMSMMSCGKSFLELEPIGTQLESNFYQTDEEIFEGVVAVYDVTQWGGTNGWTMKLGLLNAASDDCYAGGSDASDQPNWVAWDNFTLDPFLGPQRGLWNKNYTGIYRANLILEKMENPDIKDMTPEKKARYIAEVKFLRAYFYFDQVRLFGNIPLITKTLGPEEIYTQTQTTPAAIYAQIESDLQAAVGESQLPETVTPDELGRITKGAAKALLGKVILFENDNARMAEAASLLEEVITSGIYALET